MSTILFMEVHNYDCKQIFLLAFSHLDIFFANENIRDFKFANNAQEEIERMKTISLGICSRARACVCVGKFVVFVCVRLCMRFWDCQNSNHASYRSHQFQPTTDCNPCFFLRCCSYAFAIVYLFNRCSLFIPLVFVCVRAIVKPSMLCDTETGSIWTLPLWFQHFVLSLF